MRTPRISRWIAIATVALATITLQSGCVILAAGAAAGGAVAYVKGEMTYTLPCGLEEASRATKKALEKDLHVSIKSTKFEDSGRVVYEADTSIGGRAVIKLDPMPGGTTKISIRIGTFGDENKSRDILEAIKKRIR